MSEVPDDLGAGFAACTQHRQEARPVVTSRCGFDQMPTQPVAHGADTMRGKHSVIGLGIDVVTCCGNQVEALAIASPMRRALEPPEKEAFEWGADAGNMWHGEFGSTSLDRCMQPALVASGAVTADCRGDPG